MFWVWIILIDTVLEGYLLEVVYIIGNIEFRIKCILYGYFSMWYDIVHLIVYIMGYIIVYRAGLG